MSFQFIPMEHEHAAKDVSVSQFNRAMGAAITDGRALGYQRQGDALLGGFFHQLSEELYPAVKGYTRQGVAHNGTKVLVDRIMGALGRVSTTRQGDAAQTFSRALEGSWGNVIETPFTPRRLIQDMPKKMVDAWAETIRIKFISHTGGATWMKGNTEKIARAGYGVREELRPIHTLVTATEKNWKQTLAQKSPKYQISAEAERAKAAKFALEKAMEKAMVTRPQGLDMWTFKDMPSLRRTSPLNYNTASGEDMREDFERMLQTVSEESEGVFEAKGLLITQRIINKLTTKATTSGGYPIDQTEWFKKTLSKYGVTNHSIVPTLRDYGGTFIDALVLYDPGENGLKRVLAMDITPFRTVQQGLSDLTYYMCRPGGLYTPHAGATYIYEIQVG